MSKWTIDRNYELTEDQIDFLIEKLKGTLLFIVKDDEWFPVGAIDDENEKQAKCIMDALNKMNDENA